MARSENAVPATSGSERGIGRWHGFSGRQAPRVIFVGRRSDGDGRSRRLMAVTPFVGRVFRSRSST